MNKIHYIEYGATNRIDIFLVVIKIDITQIGRIKRKFVVRFILLIIIRDKIS